MTNYTKPIPVPDDETSGFWEAARKHEFAFQRCQHCGTFAHPPVGFCNNCHRVADPLFAFETVSGRGKIVNWTVMYDTMVSGFENDVPWVHALVAMDAQPRLHFAATLEDGLSDRLKIGAPVEVAFRDITDSLSIPYFKLAD